MEETTAEPPQWHQIFQWKGGESGLNKSGFEWIPVPGYDLWMTNQWLNFSIVEAFLEKMMNSTDCKIFLVRTHQEDTRTTVWYSVTPLHLPNDYLDEFRHLREIITTDWQELAPEIAKLLMSTPNI